jgi:hypothetical protein
MQALCRGNAQNIKIYQKERCCTRKILAAQILFCYIHLLWDLFIVIHDFLIFHDPLWRFQNRAKNAAPITATTPPLICECEAAPGNGTIVAELVGLADVTVDVEVPFPVTLKIQTYLLDKSSECCFSHHSVFGINSERKGAAYFVNQKMNKSKSSGDMAQRWIVIGSCVRSDMYNRFLRSLRRLLLLCLRGAEGCQRSGTFA